MLHTAELDMADSVTPNDVDVFLDNAAWAIHSTYHTVLKASPGCCKLPRYVLYKCTYVPYDGTYGASDQGQMLDV
jgi:hypothetical protein